MFSDRYGLTQAVLDGKKTMTRRKVITPADMTCDFWNPVMGIDDKGKVYFTVDCCDGRRRDIYPQYQIGEVLVIAQPYKNIIAAITPTYGSPHAYDGLRREAGWNNKMFVRADLMPHRIRIKNIKVERLQDISDVDCRKEGIIHVNWRQYLKQDVYDFTPQKYKEHSLWTLPIFEESFLDSWAEKKPGEYAAESTKVAFAVLIFKLMGRKVWEQNHFVFAYEFELVR